jgi:putative membrane protein
MMSSDPTPATPRPAEAEAALGAGRERRLHPLSWLFVLLAQLKEFALPLVALLFFGRGGDGGWEWAGLVAAAVLTGIAVVRYFTYRFRIDGNELVIRSGVLHRNLRNIPLSRIQNVALKRNLLHRAFGVAEVRLESAVGGSSAEAQMRVLSMRDARALEALVQAQAERAPAASERVDDDRAVLGEELLALSTVELVKLGLTSNRGLLIGAAGFGAFSQLDSAGVGGALSNWATAAFGYARGLDLGVAPWLAVILVAAVALVLVLRLVSVLLVLTRFHDFRLRELDGRLSVESGLLTRIRSHAPLRKIQHWTLREGVLHRWFGRRSLRVETAVMQTANESQTLSDLVPIAAPAQIDALLQRWLPWLDWQQLQWQPLHPQAWRRMAFLPLALTLLATVLLTARFGLAGLLLLTLLPWWIFRARRIAVHSQWALTDRLLLWRSGWLDRRVSFAEIGKLQGLQLLQSPFDRRRGMATLIADTAGASPLGHRLELHYLPVDIARQVHDRVGAQVARSALRW